MSEFIITNKTITLFIVIALVFIIVTGIISYNLGVSYGLKQSTSVNQQQNTVTENNNLVNTAPINNTPTNSNNEEEVVVSGKPVTYEGKTILNGTVGIINNNSFSFNVESEILDPGTRTFSTKITSYTVAVTADTIITENISNVTIPPGGGPPNISSSTKNLKLADMKPNQKVTVTTGDSATEKTITALEVVVTTVIRK
ncbi:MAG: hypothetical protein ABIJ81_02000 [Patescibacteria group bacterium]